MMSFVCVFGFSVYFGQPNVMGLFGVLIGDFELPIHQRTQLKPETVYLCGYAYVLR